MDQKTGGSGVKGFVNENSIVRKIWGRADTTLLIFAGAAAEFALNKAVDWLYFTGKLPADPLGRLFSTVTYARRIIFADEAPALQAIDQITVIHQGVETARGTQIPDWAYRDVLYLLIDYSIRSFELLDRKLTPAELDDIYDVFYRMGCRMHLKDLPDNYLDWQLARSLSLDQNIAYSKFTADLYQQYKKHLGRLRYRLVLQIQSILVPPNVSSLLKLNTSGWIISALKFYRFLRRIRLDKFFRDLLLPVKYKEEIKSLEVAV